MSDDAPLILNKFESGLLAGMPRAQPDTVFVLSYADSSLRTFQRAPGLGDRAGSKWCYVVDRSQRITNGELRIPTYGGVYFFSVWYDAAWQVSDPEAVVRANLPSGDPVVAGFLKNALWPLGRQFDPDQVGQAEDTIVRSLQPPMAVGSGLTLNGLSLRMAADPRKVDTSVADDEETRRLQQVQTRVTALQKLIPNAEPALLLHVATHPDDTTAGLDLFNQTRQHDANYRLALLDRLFQNGILTDADGDALRQLALGGTGAALPSGTTAAQPALGPGSASSVGAPVLGGGSWNVPVLGPTPVAPAPQALQSGSPQAPSATPSSHSPQSRPAPAQAPASGHGGPQDQPFGARPPATPRRAPDPNGPQDQPTSAQRPASAVEQAPAQPPQTGGVRKWKKFERPTTP